ncbi:MAG: RNA-binding S4 domain-containing protein [Cyanobacteria bacterium P01_E01_bin.42]
MEEQSDSPKTIKLDGFLKIVGATSTGGQAKILIQSGRVTVNGEVETRRRRKLVDGDRVSANGQMFRVHLD